MRDLPVPPHLHLLGIDYGEARIGVAGSDGLGLLAHPLETIASYPRPEALRRIGAICIQRQVTAVVLGLPIRADGTEGKASEIIRAFSEALLPHLSPDTELIFQDEYGTTKEASDNLRASGKRTKTHRPIIDQAAAVIILQNYLDSQQLLLPEE